MVLVSLRIKTNPAAISWSGKHSEPMKPCDDHFPRAGADLVTLTTLASGISICIPYSVMS